MAIKVRFELRRCSLARLGEGRWAQLDKVLKGAKPAELPVVQPSEFKLAVNLRTAKALGFQFPHALRMRADEVIE